MDFDPVDGRWTSCGRAGAAEIAWEEGSRRGKPVKSRVANFLKKKGTLLLRFSGCGNGMSWPEFCCRGSRRGKPLKSRVANFSKKKGLYF